MSEMAVVTIVALFGWLALAAFLIVLERRITRLERHENES